MTFFASKMCTMNSKFIYFFAIYFILSSCTNPVRIKNRIEQTYTFSSGMYTKYEDPEKPGERDISGSIQFNNKDITVLLNGMRQQPIEVFTIKKVTYNSNPTELKYWTDKGRFSIKIKNDTIFDVSYDSGSYLVIFHKAKEKIYVNHNLPLQLPKPEIDWKRIEISDVGTIDLSPKLEIQYGEYIETELKIQDSVQKIIVYKFNEPTLVLQPKGIKQFEEDIPQRYCRIIFKTVTGNYGEFQNLNEKIILTSSDIFELNEDLKNQALKAFKNIPGSLIEWFPIQINEINGMPCIHINYVRQYKNNPNAMVDMYRFYNNNRIHYLTISYRLSEKDYWNSELTNTLNSFRITKIN